MKFSDYEKGPWAWVHDELDSPEWCIEKLIEIENDYNFVFANFSNQVYDEEMRTSVMWLERIAAWYQYIEERYLGEVES